MKFDLSKFAAVKKAAALAHADNTANLGRGQVPASWITAVKEEIECPTEYVYSKRGVVFENGKPLTQPAPEGKYPKPVANDIGDSRDFLTHEVFQALFETKTKDGKYLNAFTGARFAVTYANWAMSCLLSLIETVGEEQATRKLKDFTEFLLVEFTKTPGTIHRPSHIPGLIRDFIESEGDVAAHSEKPYNAEVARDMEGRTDLFEEPVAGEILDPNLLWDVVNKASRAMMDAPTQLEMGQHLAMATKAANDLKELEAIDSPRHQTILNNLRNAGIQWHKDREVIESSSARTEIEAALQMIKDAQTEASAGEAYDSAILVIDAEEGLTARVKALLKAEAANLASDRIEELTVA